MIENVPCKGLIAGVPAVLQLDGTVKTWGTSATTKPLHTMPVMAGLKSVLKGLDGQVVYLLESGSAYLASTDAAATQPLQPLETLSPPTTSVPPSGNALDAPLALVCCSDGNGAYVNKLHEFVCRNAGSSGATPAVAKAPFFIAGVQHASANDNVMIVVKDDGTLQGWGTDTHGLLTFPVGLSGVAKVGVGNMHAVALKSDGTVVAWGDNSLGQTSVPAGLTGVVEISAYSLGDFTLARKSDGTVAAWGDDASGQVSGAATLTGIAKISAGTVHACAIGTDTTLHSWGDNSVGERTGLPATCADVGCGDYDTFVCNGSSLSYFGNPLYPPPAAYLNPSNTDPLHGVSYSQLLRQGERVIAWGGYTSGTFHATTRIYVYPDVAVFGTPALDVATVSISPIGGISSVLLNAPDPDFGRAVLPISTGTWTNGNEAYGTSTGASFIATAPSDVLQAAVQDDGSLYFWGTSTALSGAAAAARPTTGTWKQVAIGYFASAALATDGTVTAWGDNSSGATSVPAGLSGVDSLLCIPNANGTSSQDTFVALKTDGTVVVWGYLGTTLSGLSGETDVAAMDVLGNGVFLLRRDRTLGWYPVSVTAAPYTLSPQELTSVVANDAALAGISSLTGKYASLIGELPYAMDWPSPILKLSAGYRIMAVQREDGSLSVWRWEAYFDNSYSTVIIPDLNAAVSQLGSFAHVGNFAAGSNAVFVVLPLSGAPDNGGALAQIELGDSAAQLTIPTALTGANAAALKINPVVDVAAGDAHVMVRFANGTVQVFGDNTFGQLSNAYAGNDVAAIACSSHSCLVLKTDGTLHQWGQTSTPPALTGVSKIAGTCAADAFAAIASGQVSVWGYAGRLNVTPPAGITDAVDVVVGNSYYLILRSDGSVALWTTTSQSVDAVPAGLPPLVQLGTGDANYCFGLDSAGNIYAWGFGTLTRWPYEPSDPIKTLVSPGNPIVVISQDDTITTMGPVSGAVPVPARWRNESDIASFSSGDAGSFIVHSDGTVTPVGTQSWAIAIESMTDVAQIVQAIDIAFVIHTDGSLSEFGTANWSLTPPAGLTGVTQLSIAFNSPPGPQPIYCVARKSDGSVVQWGPSLPTGPVPTLANAVKVCAGFGGNFALALLADGTVAGWGTDNGSGSLNGPVTSTGVKDIGVFGGGSSVSVALFNDGTVQSWPDTGTVLASSLSDVETMYWVAAVGWVAQKTDGSLIARDGTTLPDISTPATVLGYPTTNTALLQMAAFTLAAAGAVTTQGGPMNYDVALTDALGMGGALTSTATFQLADLLAFGDAIGAKFAGHVGATEQLGFADVVRVIYQALVTEHLALAGDVAAYRALLLSTIDTLALAAGLGSSLHAQVALASAITFGDGLARIDSANLSDALGFSAEGSAKLAATMAMLDTLRLEAATAQSVLFATLAGETLGFGDGLTASQALHATITENLGLVFAEIALDDGVYLAWVINTESRAYTRYSNYPFNSFAKIGDKYYGARDDGIYVLEGDSDAGTDIAAFVRGGLSDLGSSFLKRMHSAYLGLVTDGRMVLKVTAFNEAAVREEHWYELEERSDGVLRETRVKLGQGLKSTYWGWELANVDGADFSLDKIAWYPMVLERRLG